MKIKIVQGKNFDGALTEEMYIDDKEVLHAFPLYECPEDATLERDMISCSDVVALMKEAWIAGSEGEMITTEVVQE